MPLLSICLSGIMWCIIISAIHLFPCHHKKFFLVCISLQKSFCSTNINLKNVPGVLNSHIYCLIENNLQWASAVLASSFLLLSLIDSMLLVSFSKMSLLLFSLRRVLSPHFIAKLDDCLQHVFSPPPVGVLFSKNTD